MFEMFQLPFVQRAFLVGTIAALPFGLIGTFVVVRRIGYLAGAIAHCAFGGIGVGLFLQHLITGSILGCCCVKALCEPMSMSLLVAVCSALLIGIIQIRAKEREDTVIGVLWALGMSVGLLLLEKTPGNVGIANYLFGNIYLVTRQDVFLVTILGMAVLLIVLLFFHRLEAVCFDEQFARLRGISTGFYFLLLLVLTAVTVVLLVRIVGIVLVIAMLTLPAATAGRWTKRLFPMCLLAVVLCAVSIWLGLLLSVWLDLSPGPVIVLVASSLYLLALMKRSRS